MPNVYGELANELVAIFIIEKITKLTKQNKFLANNSIYRTIKDLSKLSCDALITEKYIILLRPLVSSGKI